MKKACSFILLVLCIAALMCPVCRAVADTSNETYELQTYTDPDGRFSIDLPKGWEDSKAESFLIFKRKSLAFYGILKVEPDEQSKDVADFMPLLIEKLKQNKEQFANLKIVEKPVVVSNSKTKVSHARISYLLSGENDFVSDLYVIANADGRPQYTLVTYVPESDKDSYRTVFEAAVRSMVINDPVAPAKTPTIEEPFVKKDEGEATLKPNAAPIKRPLYWVRNSVEIVKDGKTIFTDEAGVGTACISPNGRYIAYARNHTLIILVDIQTGKKSRVYSSSGEVTVNYKDSGSEREVVFPIGFSSDNKKVYVIKQLSSVYVGGNKLVLVNIQDGKASTVDVGVQSAAIARNGDVLILKPGNVQLIKANGDGWDIDPEYSSMYVNGVGFTIDDKPFYYTSDDIIIINSNGTEKKLTITPGTIAGRPIVAGDTIYWDDGQKVVTNESGTVKPVARQGSNRQPFM